MNPTDTAYVVTYTVHGGHKQWVVAENNVIAVTNDQNELLLHVSGLILRIWVWRHSKGTCSP